MTVQPFAAGDRVRIDIPDRDDPDFDKFHREHGRVVEVLDDAAGTMTGDERDSTLYRVELDSGQTTDFRWRDLRPIVD
jgi:hypothetical protein